MKAITLVPKGGMYNHDLSPVLYLLFCQFVQ